MLPKITIQSENGNCTKCELNGEAYACQFQPQNKDGWYRIPGPDCPGPNTYVLVPEAKYDELAKWLSVTREQIEAVIPQKVEFTTPSGKEDIRFAIGWNECVDRLKALLGEKGGGE